MPTCPDCYSHKIKKNGLTHYGKQNHKCKDCGRQFVLDNYHTVDAVSREIARRALLERISLRGICRILGESLTWIRQFAAQTWSTAPKDLGVPKKLYKKRPKKSLQLLGLQLDEAWSFVGRKRNKAWIWVAFDPHHRQVVAFHIGRRGSRDAKLFWKNLRRRFHADCGVTVTSKLMSGGRIKIYFHRIGITSVKTRLITSKDSGRPFEQE